MTLLQTRSYIISTGVDHSVRAVPALQQSVKSDCLVLADSWNPRKGGALLTPRSCRRRISQR